MALADLNIIVGANLDQFYSGMQSMVKTLQTAGAEMEATGKKLSLYVTAPIALLAGASLKAAGDMQALKKGLEAVTGSAAAANKEFIKLKEVAKLPGLGLKEAVEMSVLLQATGFSADKARNSIMQFGNALALVGRGREHLDGVLVQISQMASKTKVVAGDLKPIIERTPQIAKIIKEAFGTIDTEEIQKMGVTTATMIDTMLAGLEKLPRATGGINNAFENLKDSGTQALAGLGEAINNSFDVEGKINRFGDTVTMLVGRFNNLSPAIQKTILVFAGVAAAIGPILVGLAALSAAIAAISLPVVAVVAAVAGAAYLIINNWDAVVKFFTSGTGGKIFKDLAIIAVQSFNLIVDIVKTTVGVVMALWDRFGAGVITQAKTIWTFVADTVKTALSYIQNLFNAWKGLLTGNWSLMWESMLNMVKLIANQLISTINYLLKGILGGAAAIAGALGMDGVSKKVNGAIDSLDGFSNSIKFVITDTKNAEQAVEDLKKGFTSLSNSKPIGDTAAAFVPTVVGGSPAAAKGGGGAGQNVGFNAPIDKVALANDSDNNFNHKFGVSIDPNVLQKLNDDVMKATEITQKLPKEYPAPKMEKWYDSFDGIKAKVTEVAGHINSTMNQVGNIMSQLSQNQTVSMDNYYKKQKKAIDQSSMTEAQKAKATAKLDEEVTKKKAEQARKQAIINKVTGIMSAIVNTAVGVTGALAAIPGPVGIALAAVTAALGAAEIAIIASAPLPALANGGVAFGPTMALVGDNRNANIDPEVVAPLSKLRTIMGGSQGGSSDVKVRGEIVVEGSKLRILLQNTEREMRRTGS